MKRDRVQNTVSPAPPALTPALTPTARAARASLWGLALAAAEAVSTSVLARNTIALTILHAAVVEWGAHRAGVAWSDPATPEQANRWPRRAAAGAAWGGGVAALATAASLAIGTAAFTDGRISPAVLAVGLGMAVVEAVRDELLLRGLVLRVTDGVLPAAAGIGACAAAGACARFGADGVVSVAILFEALRAGALAALWIHDRGAWLAIGANAGFAWTARALAWAGVIGARSPRPVVESGPAIAIVTAAFLVASAVALGLPGRLRAARAARAARATKLVRHIPTGRAN
jgi:hypothetical protein